MKRNRYTYIDKNSSRDSAFICRNCGALRSNRLAGDDDERTLRSIAETALQAVASGSG